MVSMAVQFLPVMVIVSRELWVPVALNQRSEGGEIRGVRQREMVQRILGVEGEDLHSYV